MSLQELEVLHCICGHSEEEHESIWTGAGTIMPCYGLRPDGFLCSCKEFTIPNEPLEDYEPNCYRCERDAVNCECVKGFAHDERDLY